MALDTSVHIFLVLDYPVYLLSSCLTKLTFSEQLRNKSNDTEKKNERKIDVNIKIGIEITIERQNYNDSKNCT